MDQNEKPNASNLDAIADPAARICSKVRIVVADEENCDVLSSAERIAVALVGPEWT